MRVKAITATNPELDQRYALKARATWQFDYLVYWEHEQTPEWREWRERNQRLHPEHRFALTWQRFSHKVEAQCRALRDPDCDYLIWLDTDVVQRKPIETWLPLLPQKGQLCSYLGRGDKYHPETGFILYDVKHPRLPEFVQALEQIYLTDRIFTLPEWHDAYVWDHVCRELNMSRQNLCVNPRAGEAFLNSPLGEYFLHLKGDRKQNLTGTEITDTEALMRKPPKRKP